MTFAERRCHAAQSGHWEAQASKKYIWAMFEKAGQMLCKGGFAYLVEEIEKDMIYKARHTNAARCEKWSRVIGGTEEIGYEYNQFV